MRPGYHIDKKVNKIRSTTYVNYDKYTNKEPVGYTHT